ncbi:hypothetical protein [Billgrantia gudaonensis]|uniref:Uncharacterized protein n=1 Tax=Billgrantia gudaonensis TaxID=376427 RepID=A0A1G8PG70_9GAMM|nr:hypothetical protein [Halomonas gudaonensis]SDI91397.1 hypothetical protein SAMN04487954_10272 [Halomonas gudaonensis]
MMPSRSRVTDRGQNGAQRLKGLLPSCRWLTAMALGVGLASLASVALAQGSDAVESGMVATRAFEGKALSKERLDEVRGRYAKGSTTAIDEGLGVILWDESRSIGKGRGGGGNRHQAKGNDNHQSQTVTTSSHR